MKTTLAQAFRYQAQLVLLAGAAMWAIPAAAQTQYLVVTTAGDDAGAASNCSMQAAAGTGTDAACSLRDALVFAGGSTAMSINVSFDAAVFSPSNAASANTITLTAGSLNVPSRTSINGPAGGAGTSQTNLVTVSGNNASTVFTVSAGATGVQLSNLNIVDGNATQGGGIVNAGTLVVSACSIAGNTAASTVSGVTAGGGGILNSGKLTVNGSTIAGNTASAVGTPAQGGGIENSGTLMLVDGTVSGNTATASGTATGGGIFTTNAPGSSLELSGSTVSGNTADGEAGGVFSSRTVAAAISQPQNQTLQTLGDSITFGYDSSGCPAPYTPTTTLAGSYCWAGLVAYNLGYNLSDLGVSDSSVGDVSLIQIYNSPRVHGSDYGQFVSSPTSISTLMIGVVDNGIVSGETVDYFNGTRDVTEWQMQHEDVTAFMLTPNKVPANSTACTTSSNWTASTLWTKGGLQTTTSGATISCPIVGSTAYVSVMAQVGNASSISISIDGGPATAYMYAQSSATRGQSNTTSGELFRIPNLEPPPGTPAGTAPHTITITANVSGTSPVFVNWVDGNGNEAALGAGPVVFALSPYQTDIRTDASGSLPRFRSFLAEEAADLRSDGLNEITGDLSIPCTALPVSNPPVSLCDTFDGTHPLDSGHALIAAYVEQLILNYIAFGNSIVSGNTAPEAADTNDLYVDDGGDQIGVGGIGLAPLAGYGGPTQTMPPLPGSAALCGGSAANLNGLTADQRGLPRTTVYGATTCVDSGAAQTHYALAFSTEPPSVANFKIPMAPAPVVALTESGTTASAATTQVSIVDSDALLTGATTADLNAGTAVFSNLVAPSATGSDALLATLALTPALNLTAISSTFKVTQATPTVAVTVTSSSLTVLQTESVTITVNGGAGGPGPTGSVTLKGGGYTSAATTLSNGSATIAIAAGALAVGTATLTASYVGDSTYLAATGTSPPIAVSRASSSVAVIPSATSITAVQSLSVEIVVSAASGSPAPTGSVKVASGTYAPAASTLASGSATITVPAGALALGSDTLMATYSGDTRYQAATAAAQPVTVARASPTFAVTASPTGITTTQTLTVTVAMGGGSGNPTPTGAITLTGGAFNSNVSALLSGSVTVEIPGGMLPVGTDALNISYSGDGTYLAASDSALAVAVSKTAAPITIAPSALSITAVEPLNVTVTVNTVAGGTTPTGAVVLTGGTYNSNYRALTGGSVTIAIPAGALALGSDTLSVSYSGDGTYLAGSATAAAVPVSKANSSVALTTSATGITTTQGLNALVRASGADGEPAPTGTVSIAGGGYASAPVALSNGSAAIAIPAGALTAGADSIAASYSGDNAYLPATASAQPVTVAKSASTIAVTPSAPSITPMQMVTVSAMASGGAGNPTPTGSVILSCGAYTSAATTISNGSATIAVPAGALAAGADTLSVNYSGDATYLAASGSAAIAVQSFSVAGTAVTVAPGAASGNSSTISIAPSGGFTGPVVLAAVVTSSPAGALSPPTFSFGASSPVTLTTASAGTATLVISTTASTTATCSASSVTRRPAPWYAGGGAVLACVCLLGIPARRRWRSLMGMLLLLAMLGGGVLACGGGAHSTGNSCPGPVTPGTTAGAYTITVTGTSGLLKESGTVTLTVQ